MKKYTNKILIIAAAIIFIVSTIFFCFKVRDIKEDIKQNKAQQSTQTINK